MITVVLFDLFFVACGIFAAVRLINAFRLASVTYGKGHFSRAANPRTFWIVCVGYVGLIVGAIYGVAVGFGL